MTLWFLGVWVLLSLFKQTTRWNVRPRTPAVSSRQRAQSSFDCSEIIRCSSGVSIRHFRQCLSNQVPSVLMKCVTGVSWVWQVWREECGRSVPEETVQASKSVGHHRWCVPYFKSWDISLNFSIHVSNIDFIDHFSENELLFVSTRPTFLSFFGTADFTFCVLHSSFDKTVKNVIKLWWTYWLFWHSTDKTTNWWYYIRLDKHTALGLRVVL